MKIKLIKSCFVLSVVFVELTVFGLSLAQASQPSLESQIQAQQATGSDRLQDSFRWLDFRVNQISLLQVLGNRWNASFSTEASWTPSYRFTERFSLIGAAGASQFISKTNQSFFMLEYLLLMGYSVGPVVFEVGGGVQTWLIPSQTIHSNLINLNTHYRFHKKLFSVIDSLFMGYSLLFQDPLSHQAKVGVQVSF